MAISEQRMEAALAFLAETDSEYAERVGAVMRYEFMLEAAESTAYAMLEGSVEDRKRASKLAEPVKKAQEDLIQATVERERVRAQRKRAEITIEAWRSLNANRRVGNI